MLSNRVIFMLSNFLYNESFTSYRTAPAETYTYFSRSRQRYFVIDSFPLPVCKFGRARYCRSFRENGANYGKCSSKKEIYFGFKAHALITLEGYITAFEVTSASAEDREGLRNFAKNRLGLVILGDKGYTGEQLFEDMGAKGICLMSLKPSNYKTNWSEGLRRLIFGFRRRIETVFSHLSEQMRKKVIVKSFRDYVPGYRIRY